MKLNDPKGLYLNEEFGFVPDELKEIKTEGDKKQNEKKKNKKNKRDGKDKAHKDRSR